MKEYKFTMSSGFVGTDREDFFEFDDDVTEKEIHDAWTNWVWEFIDGNHIEIEGSNHRADE